MYLTSVNGVKLTFIRSLSTRGKICEHEEGKFATSRQNKNKGSNYFNKQRFQNVNSKSKQLMSTYHFRNKIDSETDSTLNEHQEYYLFLVTHQSHQSRRFLLQAMVHC